MLHLKLHSILHLLLGRAEGRSVPMKVSTRIMTVLFVVTLLVTLAGCGQGQTSSGSGTAGNKICYAYQGLASTFWVGALNAVTRGLKAKGFQMVAYDGQQNANTQLQQVKTVLTREWLESSSS